MPRVWLSLGSNVDRERNIRAAVAQLGDMFGELVISPVYESEAVGFEGTPFFNLVVGIQTTLGIDEVVSRLHAIENNQGRVRGESRFISRTLDIDMLTYGSEIIEQGKTKLPRNEITRYAFVLRPLADVAGSEIHPITQRTYQALWADFDEADQSLWRASLQFDT